MRQGAILLGTQLYRIIYSRSCGFRVKETEVDKGRSRWGGRPFFYFFSDREIKDEETAVGVAVSSGSLGD